MEKWLIRDGHDGHLEAGAVSILDRLPAIFRATAAFNLALWPFGLSSFIDLLRTGVAEGAESPDGEKALMGTLGTKGTVWGEKERCHVRYGMKTRQAEINESAGMARMSGRVAPHGCRWGCSCAPWVGGLPVNCRRGSSVLRVG